MSFDTLKAIGPRINYTEKYQKEKAQLEKEFQSYLDEWRTYPSWLSTIPKSTETCRHCIKALRSVETFSWNQMTEIMFATPQNFLIPDQ
jgi:hypothetical protein